MSQAELLIFLYENFYLMIIFSIAVGFVIGFYMSLKNIISISKKDIKIIFRWYMKELKKQPRLFKRSISRFFTNPYFFGIVMGSLFTIMFEGSWIFIVFLVLTYIIWDYMGLVNLEWKEW